MVSHPGTPDDFRPTAPWENLRLRAELLRRLRAFFDGRGFLEVETPVLSADTVIDRHLDPFGIEARVGGREKGEGGRGKGEPAFRLPPSPFPRLWLQTSPEFHMKRLLAAGAGPIYQVARVFRQDELGPLHNPEFTLLEWYQPGEGMDAGMQLTSDLCEAMLQCIRHTPCAAADRLVRHGAFHGGRHRLTGATDERGVCRIRFRRSGSATARRSSGTPALTRTRPTARRSWRRCESAASSRRRASIRPTATAGSIC